MLSPLRQVERLERQYPYIDWRNPVKVKLVEDGVERYGCRLCIAIYGLNGSQVTDLPMDDAAFRKHMREVHQI